MKLKSLFVATLFACTMLIGLNAQASDQININTATVEQLQMVKGIGPKTAEAIVAYRKANGGFGKVDDLENVKGIGEKKLKKIKGDLTAGKAQDQNDGHHMEKHDS